MGYRPTRPLCESLKLLKLGHFGHRQDAERTVRAEFEGQAPGILYVADYVADSYEESPYTSDNIESVLAIHSHRPSPHSNIDSNVVFETSPHYWRSTSQQDIPHEFL